MFILGLTGSIGMGKTWGAKCFRLQGVPVHDADQCVHDLMAPGGTATKIVASIFGDVLNEQGGVDRQKLSTYVLGDDGALDKLENLLHPLVRQSQRHFLQNAQRRQDRLVVLDVPLLFETGAYVRVDATVVMSASAQIQRQRVMRRPGMTEQKFQTILGRQLDDDIKRQLADFIVGTNATRGESLRQIVKIATVCKRKEGVSWSPHWGR